MVHDNGFGLVMADLNRGSRNRVGGRGMVRIIGEGEGEGPTAAMAVDWASGQRPWLVVVDGPATGDRPASVRVL